jgi:hypothetical protein
MRRLVSASASTFATTSAPSTSSDTRSHTRHGIASRSTTHASSRRRSPRFARHDSWPARRDGCARGDGARPRRDAQRHHRRAAGRRPRRRRAERRAARPPQHPPAPAPGPAADVDGMVLPVAARVPREARRAALHGHQRSQAGRPAQRRCRDRADARWGPGRARGDDLLPLRRRPRPRAAQAIRQRLRDPALRHPERPPVEALAGGRRLRGRRRWAPTRASPRS